MPKITTSKDGTHYICYIFFVFWLIIVVYMLGMFGWKVLCGGDLSGGALSGRKLLRGKEVYPGKFYLRGFIQDFY